MVWTGVVVPVVPLGYSVCNNQYWCVVLISVDMCGLLALLQLLFGFTVQVHGVLELLGLASCYQLLAPLQVANLVNL